MEIEETTLQGIAEDQCHSLMPLLTTLLSGSDLKRAYALLDGLHDLVAPEGCPRGLVSP